MSGEPRWKRLATRDARTCHRAGSAITRGKADDSTRGRGTAAWITHRAEARQCVPDDIAKLGRAELEQRLAAAEARLDMALPLEEKFDLGAPSPDNEARMRPIFDRVFQTKPGQPPLYTLECHGPVCRLDTEVSMNEWQEALFAEEDAIFSSMKVSEITSIPADPITLALPLPPLEH